MKHLTRREFADYVDGALPARRALHLEACAECRRHAEDVRDALRAAADADMPEPSPLFWDHFSARVREAIAAEPDRRSTWGWLWRPAVGLPLVAALVVAVSVVMWRGAASPTREDVAAPAVVATGEAVDPLAEPEQDDSFNLVATMAATFEWEEVEGAGFSAGLGSADRALLLLTAEERAELARLLSAPPARQEM